MNERRNQKKLLGRYAIEPQKKNEKANAKEKQAKKINANGSNPNNKAAIFKQWIVCMPEMWYKVQQGLIHKSSRLHFCWICDIWMFINMHSGLLFEHAYLCIYLLNKPSSQPEFSSAERSLCYRLLLFCCCSFFYLWFCWRNRIEANVPYHRYDQKAISFSILFVSFTARMEMCAIVDFCSHFRRFYLCVKKRRLWRWRRDDTMRAKSQSTWKPIHAKYINRTSNMHEPKCENNYVLFSSLYKSGQQ